MDISDFRSENVPHESERKKKEKKAFLVCFDYFLLGMHNKLGVTDIAIKLKHIKIQMILT